MAAEHFEPAVTEPAVNYNYFLLRRLHSLLGLVPVGAYVVVHLLVNATILFGGSAYQTAVDQIHLLNRLGVLYIVELVFIFIPLFFHALLGFKIWFSGESNSSTYRCSSNVRYTLQRVTGGIAFVFIMLHLYQMHWYGAWLGGGHFRPDAAASSAASVLQPGWVLLAYLIGVISTVFHLANGIWTALITWGITIGPRAQRASGYACTAFGLLLGLAGIGSAVGFNLYRNDGSAPSSGVHAPASEHSGAAGAQGH